MNKFATTSSSSSYIESELTDYFIIKLEYYVDVELKGRSDFMQILQNLMLLSEFGIFTKSLRKKLKKVLSSTEGINVGFWNSVQKNRQTIRLLKQWSLASIGLH